MKTKGSLEDQMTLKKNIRNYLFLIVMLLSVLLAKAQDKRFTASIYTEPQHFGILSENTDALIHFKDPDGFNFGLQVEYQMQFMYLKAQTFIFPDLKGETYYDFQGTLLGFNYHPTFSNYRLYTGGKLGFIKRSRYTYPMAGVEFGLEFYFGDFYIGSETSWNWRTDDKFWSSTANGYGRWSSGIKFGIVL